MASIIRPEGGQFAAIPTFNQLVPNEGPRQISLDLNFDTLNGGADIYDFNLEQEIAQRIIWGVQGVYYDNLINNADVTLVSSVTNQSMVFKAGWQGYRPVLFANPPRGSFSCNGGAGVMRVKLLNVPMVFGEWDAR